MSSHFRPALLLFVALLSAATARGDWLERTWTNDEGKTIKAKFIRATETMAKLNHDGNVVSVPLDRLIQTDRDWIAAANELRKLRLWQLDDGSTHRARLVGIERETVTLEEKSEELIVSLDRLNDADRALVTQVMENNVGVASASSSPSASRTWTHVNGKSIVAEFRRMEGDQVVLFWRGKEVKVKLTDLSDDDRQFVASQQPGIASPSVASSSGGPPVSSGPVAPAPTKPLAEMTPEERAAERLRKRRERAERLAQNPAPPAPYVPPPPVSAPASPPVDTGPAGGRFPEPRIHHSPPSIDHSPPPRSFPTTIPQEVIICSKCRHAHPAASFKAGDKCKGCGIIIGYIENEDGSIREVSTAHRVNQVRGVIWGVVVVFALLGALIKKIAG